MFVEREFVEREFVERVFAERVLAERGLAEHNSDPQRRENRAVQRWPSKSQPAWV